MQGWRTLFAPILMRPAGAVKAAQACPVNALDTLFAIPTVQPMTSENAVQSSPSIKREGFGVCLIILFFLLNNLLSVTRTPPVAPDEVEYTDPAANLYLGSGFTSTVWAQNRHEFWCGNVPLHQGLLFCFFKTFGFGFLQVRMATASMTALGALLIWSGLRHSVLVRSPSRRLLSLALMLSGSASVVTFRVGRYDGAMFFACALVFFACTLPERWRFRYALVILASALLPFAGIALLPYTATVLLIHFCVYRWRNIGILISVVAGVTVGLVGLYCFYRSFGVWRQFVEIVLPFTFFGSNAYQQGRTLKTLFLGDPVGNESLMTCFFGKPWSFRDPKTLFDYSAFLLFLLVLFIAFRIWRTAGERDRRLIFFFIVITLMVPPVMQIAGHYRSYYRWMTYIPLCITVPRLMDLSVELQAGSMVRRLAISVVCFSVFLGLPFRTFFAIPDWRARSVTPIEEAGRKVVKPSDIVLCDFGGYYAVRPYAKEVYCLGLPARGESALIKDFPTNEVSLLCIFPADFSKVNKTIGGQWEKVQLDEAGESAEMQTRYSMCFYRRVNR